MILCTPAQLGERRDGQPGRCDDRFRDVPQRPAGPLAVDLQHHFGVGLADAVVAGQDPARPLDYLRALHFLAGLGARPAALAVELLARLTEDLTATQDLLETGAAEADWKRLREGSHVLISLSGSVGALSLQAMSEDLNAIAHRQDRAALDVLMPPLAGELATLIQLIRATRPPLGNTR